MLKKILATTALSTLLAGPVLAQDTMAPDATIDPPALDDTAPGAELPESDVPAPDAFQDEPMDGAPATDALTGAETVLAEDVIGADLLDFEGNSIATVDDVVMDTQGTVEALLVDVGGFLGFGARTVAIPLSDVTVDVDADGETVLRTALTAEDLENLPEYEEEPEAPATEM